MPSLSADADWSQLNLGVQGEDLTIQLSWLALWVLVNCVFRVHLVESWGYGAGLW